ncbi:MAG: tRNA (N6-threonylcarbamoyladenosine(37)-N6)-methyltransferase TrmO [Desulfopila sp.]
MSDAVRGAGTTGAQPPQVQMSPLCPIGYIESCWSEKFGIPKQSGLVNSATATLRLQPPYHRPEMFRGLDAFSHVWLLFLFHDTVNEGWKPTVRPPRLGGRKRVGVFASRSPHRPNHLGMSVVRLQRLVVEGGAVRLELGGADLLDGTPVLDLKPYLPYADAIAEASAGFTAESGAEVAVSFVPGAERFCARYRRRTGRPLHELVRETLQNDPRPASQRVVGREFGILFWDVNVRWRVTAAGFVVVSCTEIRE